MIRLLVLAVCCCTFQLVAAQDFHTDRIAHAIQQNEASEGISPIEFPPIGPAQDILKDSIYQYAWNTASGEWVLNKKFYYHKDCSLGNPTMLLVKKFSTTTASFIDTLRQTYTYFPDGSVQSYLNELWFPNEQAWKEQRFQSYIAPNLLEMDRAWVINPNFPNQLNGEKQVFTYNPDGLETSAEKFLWNISTDQWEPENRSFTTYNPDQTISEWYSEYFDDVQGSYVSNTKSEYVYDNGLLILGLGYAFIQGQFQQTSQVEYEYDLNENLISNKSFIMYGGSLVPTVKDEYTYDAFNNLLEKNTFVYQTLGDNTPTIWGKRIYERYPSGKLRKESYLIPIDQGMEWLTYSEDSLREDSAYVYRILKYELNQALGMFTEGYKDLYLYDAAGNPIDVFYFNLQSYTLDNWIPDIEIISSYDGNGLLLEQVRKKWLAGAGNFLNASRQVHFYSTCPVSSANGDTGSQNNACVHANPIAEGQMVVCPDLTTYGDCVVELHNFSGVKILSQAFSPGGTRLENIASLPAGIYLLVVRGENGVHYRQKVFLAP